MRVQLVTGFDKKEQKEITKTVNLKSEDVKSLIARFFNTQPYEFTLTWLREHGYEQ